MLSIPAYFCESSLEYNARRLLPGPPAGSYSTYLPCLSWEVFRCGPQNLTFHMFNVISMAMRRVRHKISDGESSKDTLPESSSLNTRR